MVARKPTAKRYEQKKTASAADKPKKPTPVKKPAPAKQTKPVKEKSTKPSPLKKAGKGKVRKVQKGKRSLRLVDEDEKAQPEHKPKVEDEEYDLQRGIQMSLELFQAPVGGVAFREPTSSRRTPVTEEASTRPFVEPQDDTFANVVRDTPSPVDAKIGADTDKTNSSDIKMLDVDEDQDPGNTLESRPPQDKDQAGSNPIQSNVALAGPNHEPMHEDFVATVYP
ncbi:hypothetical protein Tco_0570278 [Tanacetum coccineum]